MPVTIEGQFQEHYWGSWDQVETFRHRAAAALVREGPVLDIGAGDGFFLGLLERKRGIRGVGVDVSQAAADKAAKKGIDVRVIDLASGRLPFGDASFKTVILLDVLEHFFRPELVLAEAARLSSSELVVGVPNFSSLPARVQASCGRVPENNTPRKGHVYWFTWRKLAAMLEAAGFEVVEARFNANFSSKPVVGPLFARLAARWPSLFALSFVVRARKKGT